MTQSNCEALENLCPVECDDVEKCCVALVCTGGLIGEGISQGLNNHESIYLQDQFNGTAELLNTENPPCYEVVLINARLIEYPLTDFFETLQKKTPRAKYIVISTEAEHSFLISLMRAGVYGYLPMDTSLDEICEAILAVKSGKLWFDKLLLDEVVFNAMEVERIIEQSIKERIDILSDRLTNRERDVFCLVLQGLSTREIASQIHMSEPTVKQHLTRLFKKFDVHNRSQLILSAFERVCPVSNMIKLFRRTLDKKRIARGDPPIISDPLAT